LAKHGLPTILLGAFLTACATGDGSGQARPTGSPAASATTAFDGDWRGTGQLTATTPRNCSDPVITKTMQVRNGTARLDYEVRTNTMFTGTVGADGSLEMASGNRTFRGSFAGNTFTGQYFHPTCPREWTMRRVATR
jgi:hypothetical protein